MSWNTCTPTWIGAVRLLVPAISSLVWHRILLQVTHSPIQVHQHHGLQFHLVLLEPCFKGPPSTRLVYIILWALLDQRDICNCTRNRVEMLDRWCCWTLLRHPTIRPLLLDTHAGIPWLARALSLHSVNSNNCGIASSQPSISTYRSSRATVLPISTAVHNIVQYANLHGGTQPIDESLIYSTPTSSLRLCL